MFNDANQSFSAFDQLWCCIQTSCHGICILEGKGVTALRHSGATSDKTHGSTKEASQITVLLQLFQLVTLHLPFSCHNFQILSQFLWQLRFHIREFATQERKCCWCWWAEGFSPSALCWFASNSSESGKQAVGQNMAWHARAGLQAPHAWMNALNSGSYIPSIQLCTRTQMQRLPNRYVRIPSKVDTYFLSRPTLHAHMISHDMTGRSIQKFSINYPWLLGASQKFMSAQLQVKIYAWANLLRLMHTVSASMTFLSSTFQSNRISARIDSCLATVRFRKIFRARNYRDTHIQFWSPSCATTYHFLQKPQSLAKILFSLFLLLLKLVH